MNLEHFSPESPPMALTEVIKAWGLETPRSLEDAEKIFKLEKDGGKELIGGDHSNQVEIVKLKNDGLVIFKPKSGEVGELRGGLEKGIYYQREEAAYLVDVFLDFGLVPPTVIREFDGKIGSAQELVTDAWVAEELSLRDKKEVPASEWIKLALFDFIIRNHDRNAGNYLVTKDKKKVIAIDNGTSFGVWGNWHTSVEGGKELYDIPVLNEIIEKFRIFLNWQDGKGALLDLLERRMSKEEAEACLKRIERIGSLLIEHGMIRIEDLKYLTFNGEEKK